MHAMLTKADEETYGAEFLDLARRAALDALGPEVTLVASCDSTRASSARLATPLLAIHAPLNPVQAATSILASKSQTSTSVGATVTSTTRSGLAGRPIFSRLAGKAAWWAH
jgi:hypothetical protein